jgi:uncharacterized protein YjbI with pentapeptide repeats
MADKEQLERLWGGVEEWNQWREENPNAKIDLEEADLGATDLHGVNLLSANLLRADFWEALLIGAYLSGAILDGIDLRGSRACRDKICGGTAWRNKSSRP